VGAVNGAVVVCVDVGSTYTKAALVDLAEGRLRARAEHPTTLDTDVMDGVDRCVDELAATDPRAWDAEVLGCSSAGGGLRIAVVGNEPLVTGEAGRRVALSSGGRVVHVSAGRPDGSSSSSGSGGPDESAVAALRVSAPDVVLLVGGTDGGNSEVLLRRAEELAGWPGPVVVAGNAAAAAQVAALLAAGGTPHEVTDNVLPRIGVLDPEPARRAIRAMFLRHVIGGKHLSARPDFEGLVRAATPDAVALAVDLLARGLDEEHPGAGDLVVVDVGGATTDVYSAVEPTDDEPGGLSRVDTVEAALAAGLPVRRDAADRARARHEDPAYLPDDPEEEAFDGELAELALGLALRRHAGRAQVRFDPAGGGRLLERSGTDLREVTLLVASGGTLRHRADAEARLSAPLAHEGGWLLPRSPRTVVDRDYVLAAAGLLADPHPRAAYLLLHGLVARPPSV
jgi:hypothetical protein